MQTFNRMTEFSKTSNDSCKRTHGLATCYRWFDYLGTLFVGVEPPTYKLVMLQAQPTS